MRVLHIHSGKDGGSERFLVTLAKALGQRGVEQRFVIRPGRAWGAELRSIGPVIEDSNRRLSPHTALTRWRLAHMARHWRPDAALAWMTRAAQLLPEGPRRLLRLGDFPESLAPFAKVDALIGNTPDIGRHCRELGWARPMLTISNFPRQIAPAAVDRAAHGTPPGAFLVVGAGRFVHRKGMDLLIEAVAKLPQAWLWLIGDGRERPALEAQASALGIAARTRFLGWVPEPIHHLAAADAVVLPSRHEPLGNVVLEAWHAGIATVATRSEGPSWYMEDGVSGLMADVGDADGIAAALSRLAADPALRARLVEGARAAMAARFSEEAVAAAYIRAFAGDADG